MKSILLAALALLILPGNALRQDLKHQYGKDQFLNCCKSKGATNACGVVDYACC